jgi:hypothetical protein
MQSSWRSALHRLDVRVVMIADHLGRNRLAGGDGATEEGLGGGRVTVLAQKHVHNLPAPVDGPIEGALLGAMEEEYLVDPPEATGYTH